MVSDDSRYNGTDPDDVQLVNKDDADEAGFTITPAGGRCDNGGRGKRYIQP